MVERLCAMADLPKPRIAIIDTDVPNAFATGRTPKHAAVAVTTGLWRRLEPKEVEGVLAHELSHIANRDVLVMTVASFFAMLAAMLTRFGLYAGMFGGGGGTATTTTTRFPIWLIVLVVSMVTYAISFVLIRTISRYREYAADRGSALITGRAEYLMSALQKISRRSPMIPQRDLREVAGMNAFFIIPTNCQVGDRGAVHGSPAAREAARRARRDRALDGQGRLARRGPDRPPLRAQEAQGAGEGAGSSRCRPRASRSRPSSGCAPWPAGVCFKPLSAAEFVRAENELQELLDKVAVDNGTKIERSSDSYGYEWLVLRDSQLEDLVTGVHAIGEELIAAGSARSSSPRSSASTAKEHPVYWIYGYKRGAFWPFVPTGEDQERDNAEELELKAKLEKELPIEPDITRWFAVFDARPRRRL